MRALTLFLAMLAFLALASCVHSLPNPVAAANEATPDNRPETIAFALFSSFTVLEELAADIKEAPATPAAVGEALKRADALASPFAEALHAGATALSQLRGDIAAGRADPAALPAALADLNVLITTNAPELSKFTEAFKKARRGEATT